MKSFKIISIYIVGLLYIIVGIKHFTSPDFFMVIVPPFIKWKYEAVLISGFFEVFFGLLLLFNKTRKIASWCIILLLIAVFPANIYLFTSELPRELLGVSKKQALIRLPFQFTLMIIAYWHSKNSQSKSFSTICIILFFFTILYFISI